MMMARKSRNGYYVDGGFIARGSDEDQQFRNEMKGTEELSRTERKAASARLQELGEQLLTLRSDLLDGLALPEKLLDAVLDAKRITNFEGMRRQKQFIGRLMHRLEPADIDAVVAALERQHRKSNLATEELHRAEKWRDELIADDASLQAWLADYPATDAQQLRALIRQARKDAKDQPPGEARRKGRAYREIFAVVNEQLRGKAD